MAGGQPRGCRRQIYERLSPRQVHRGSKHRGRKGCAGGSGGLRTHRAPDSVPRISRMAALRFPRPPPSSGRGTPAPPRGWWWRCCCYYYFQRDIRSRFIHFRPFPSFASLLGSQPAAATHAPSRRARSPPPRAGAPRCSGAGRRRRPSLPAGSPLPRAGKCRKSSPSPPALSPGLDRSRRSPATGCKTHQPFRGFTRDGITIILL